MTRDRMKLLQPGDRLTWKVSRRQLTVKQEAQISKNGTVKIQVQWDERADDLLNPVVTLSSRDGYTGIEQFEIDKDIQRESTQHLIDYHGGNQTAFEFDGTEWCCLNCGMVIDGNGNGTQAGRL